MYPNLIVELVQSFVSHHEVNIAAAISRGAKFILVLQNLWVHRLGFPKSAVDVELTQNMG